jgi:hypothetical protein
LGRPQQPKSTTTGRTTISEPKKFFNAVLANIPTKDNFDQMFVFSQPPHPDKSDDHHHHHHHPSVVSRLLHMFGTRKDDSKKKRSHNPFSPFSVTDPTDAKRDLHIAPNADGTFDMVNIPPEWIEILQMAGIKKNDFKDAAKADVILNTMAEFKDHLTPTHQRNNVNDNYHTTPTPATKPTTKPPPIHVAKKTTTSPSTLFATTTTDVSSSPPKRYRAKFKFDAAPNTQQISVQKGETFTLIKKISEDWLKIQCDDGRIGRVPANHCKEVAGDDTPAIANRKRPVPSPGSNNGTQPQQDVESTKQSATQRQLSLPPPPRTIPQHPKLRPVPLPPPAAAAAAPAPTVLPTVLPTTTTPQPPSTVNEEIRSLKPTTSTIEIVPRPFSKAPISLMEAINDKKHNLRPVAALPPPIKNEATTETVVDILRRRMDELNSTLHPPEPADEESDNEFDD